jgi:hypothetical protein
MSLQFISVNTPSNIIAYIGSGNPVITSHSVFTTMVDDSDFGIKDLLIDKSSHKFDEIMAGKPYVDVYYDGTNIVGTLMNVDFNFPSVVKVSLFGGSYDCEVNGDYKFVFPVSIHPAISEKRVNVAIKAEGFPPTSIEIGGSNDGAEAITFLDEDGVYNVTPSNSGELASYWQNKLVDLQWSAVDLATITGLLAHTMFTYVLPNMEQLNLTVEEQNGLKELQTNLLPLIATNLSTVAPDENTMDIHYASYRYHLYQANEAIKKYIEDKTKISKYSPFE